MELIKQLNEMGMAMRPEAQEEMKRIAEYWMENGRDMGEDELREAIAMDLEQLEYPADAVEQMVPQIMQMVRGGAG